MAGEKLPESEIATISIPSFVEFKGNANPATTKVRLTTRRVVASVPDGYRSNRHKRVDIALPRIAAVQRRSSLKAARVAWFVVEIGFLLWIASRFVDIGPEAVWDYATSTMGRSLLLAGVLLSVLVTAVAAWQTAFNLRQMDIVVSTVDGARYRLPVSRTFTAQVDGFIDSLSKAASSVDNS